MDTYLSGALRDCRLIYQLAGILRGILDHSLRRTSSVAKGSAEEFIPLALRDCSWIVVMVVGSYVREFSVCESNSERCLVQPENTGIGRRAATGGHKLAKWASDFGTIPRIDEGI